MFVEEEDEALEMERNGRFEVWAALPIQESLEVAFMVFLEVGRRFTRCITLHTTPPRIPSFNLLLSCIALMS